MDISALIKQSFSIAWNNRVLWFFGALAGGAGGAGGGANVQIPSPSGNSEGARQAQQFGENFEKFFNSISPEAWVYIIIGIAISAFVVLFFLVFVSNWASAALVYSVLRRNSERPNLRSGAKAGLQYWLKFFSLTLLFGLAILAVILMLAMPFFLLFFAGLEEVAIVLGILAVLLLVVFVIALAVFGGIVIILAQRLIIHRHLGVLDSLQIAGGLLKKHIGESLLAWAVSIGVSFAAGFLGLFLVLPILGVIAFLFFINFYAALAAAIPALVILIIVAGLWNAFQASYWTLFYEHLVIKEGW